MNSSSGNTGATGHLFAKKDALIKGGKIPGCPKPGSVKKGNRTNVNALLSSSEMEDQQGLSRSAGIVQPTTGQIFTKLHARQLRLLLTSNGEASSSVPVYPCYLDFSAPQFQLEDDDFLAACPNVLKEYVHEF
jgi:hypothetical protein